MAEYTKNDCKRDTQEHIDTVQRMADVFINKLFAQVSVHDESKLQSPELEIFTEYTPKLKASTYGSEEYEGFRKAMKVALDHHYSVNRHHPEYHPNGIRDMNLIDLIEMFCDWKAATMRHDDGDLAKSIEINKTRFNMSDDLAQIFMNSVDLFK